MRRSDLLSALAVALALSACQSMPHAAQAPVAAPAPTAAAPAAPAPAPAALPNDNLNATVWMQQTVEYAAVTQTVYRAAEARLDQALKDKTWDALVPEEREKPAANLPPAVIVDVDETVLDNSPYQARLVRSGGDYDEASWAAWVNERRARAIPGAVAFAQAAAARGITVLYISNRAVDLDQATIDNLKSEGFPVKDASVFMGLGTFVPGCEQNGTEKDCRRRLASRHYRILLQVGDQLGDFVQIISNTPEGRAALFRQYQTWFGQRWFMLPNPSYGSWEPALFNNDWTQPADVRRKAKQDALRTD
ncbi:5'-nucleotidase, lipoprotein e(P4) family [Thermomonas alba]|uniref:5'-nucleotidase, lipoprotein e(P4) family n=1 Tax=Thermomonas alba TaxID=2888525 RepID=UPI001F035657|nr:HAD family acid phosphatase [Thermomonas alba]